jgi:chromosome segregation ATPase
VTKLSDIFGRKGGEGSDKVVPLLALRSGPAGAAGGADKQPPGIAQLAEQNEFLRNLLSDAGRRIAELGELNAVFNTLAEPFNNALTSLEQEKALALSLSARVEEQDRNFQALEREFHAIEKRATLSEAEVERLRADLEASSGHARALESERQQLAADVRNLTVEMTELKRQLEQETVARRSLAESEEALRGQLDRADKRILGLEGELAGSRERVSILEGDKRSLQSTLDDAQAENGRLSRRSSETDNLLATMRGNLGRLELSEQEAKAEKSRLASALEEATQQHQAERQALTNRIEGLQARAATAEGLLAEARQALLARAEEARAFDRKAMDASVARNSAERRVAQLEASQEASTRKIRDLESSYNSLKEENVVASKALSSRELALTRAEEKVAELSNRNAQLEADLQLGRSSIDARVVELQSALARERGERTALEGTLAGARRESERLRAQITEARSGKGQDQRAEIAVVPADTEESAASSSMPEPLTSELKRSGA